jgi:hypothetical protein
MRKRINGNADTAPHVDLTVFEWRCETFIACLVAARRWSWGQPVSGDAGRGGKRP